jgi:hypothetical protein
MFINRVSFVVLRHPRLTLNDAAAISESKAPQEIHATGRRVARLEIADLCRYGAFPSQYEWHARYLLELPFRYPFLKNPVLSLQAVEANHHSGYNQIIPLRWLRTGFGGNSRPRPLFICQCCRSVRRVYFKRGHLACRRCQNAIYASQICASTPAQSCKPKGFAASSNSSPTCGKATASASRHVSIQPQSNHS